MPKPEPSVLQFEYAKQIGNCIMDAIYKELRDTQPAVRRVLTGNAPTDHLPSMPDSMVRQFSAKAGEELRKLIIDWFREAGVTPD